MICPRLRHLKVPCADAPPRNLYSPALSALLGHDLPAGRGRGYGYGLAAPLIGYHVAHGAWGGRDRRATPSRRVLARDPLALYDIA